MYLIIIFQICDADLQILCVDPSSPGSTHDSTVWRDHPLNNYLNGINEAGDINFLLGRYGFMYLINPVNLNWYVNHFKHLCFIT